MRDLLSRASAELGDTVERLQLTYSLETDSVKSKILSAQMDIYEELIRVLRVLARPAKEEAAETSILQEPSKVWRKEMPNYYTAVFGELGARVCAFPAYAEWVLEAPNGDRIVTARVADARCAMLAAEDAAEAFARSILRSLEKE